MSKFDRFANDLTERQRQEFWRLFFRHNEVCNWFWVAMCCLCLGVGVWLGKQ